MFKLLGSKKNILKSLLKSKKKDNDPFPLVHSRLWQIVIHI